MAYMHWGKAFWRLTGAAHPGLATLPRRISQTCTWTSALKGQVPWSMPGTMERTTACACSFLPRLLVSAVVHRVSADFQTYIYLWLFGLSRAIKENDPCMRAKDCRAHLHCETVIMSLS